MQPVWAGHPWVFAQAIERVEGAPSAGDVVDVVDPEGRYLGRGYYSPSSAIPVRILTRDRTDPLDGASLGRRIERAAALRRRLRLPDTESSGLETTGYRLVHAEGDGLAGLIVDVFGAVAVVQLLTIGMKRREDDVFAHVARVAGVRTVIEAASDRAAEREGFACTTRVVRGPDPGSIAFFERGLGFEVESAITQKTGFYFDQRENRERVEQLAEGARVLDLYCFVGAFGLSAARGGAASVLSVDSSAPAVAMAARNAHRHGVAGRVQCERGDVRQVLRQLQARRERFDLVIADPPKLAPSIKHLDRARSAYRKLNAEAVKVVSTDGILVTCSCSAAMTTDDFVRTATLGARDANADLTLLSLGSQGPDHPVPAAFPEGRYLKCAFFRVTR
ncbi:MAG: class I SAM-dependent rRNA methyltransferase [Sandaracinaceae bacterium]